MTERAPHREIADRRELVATAICREAHDLLPYFECLALADAAIAAIFACDEEQKR